MTMAMKKLQEQRDSINKPFYRRVQRTSRNQSFIVGLPMEYAIELGIDKGDYVKLNLDGKKIILEKIVI